MALIQRKGLASVFDPMRTLGGYADFSPCHLDNHDAIVMMALMNRPERPLGGQPEPPLLERHSSIELLVLILGSAAAAAAAGVHLGYLVVFTCILTVVIFAVILALNYRKRQRLRAQRRQ